jgi:catechol 2,3-dioxygenase-like lactoylglutathione lyase family enzyme
MTSADHSSASDRMTLHHAALYVSDLDQTRAFYTEVLGMEEIPRPADFTFPGAYFRRGGAEVHCVVETEPNRTAQLRPAWSQEELRTGYVVHFALKVASLEPFRRALAAHHLQPVGGPRIRADGVEQIYLADPDGYVVELMCFHDEETADRRRVELAASGEGVPVAPLL